MTKILVVGGKICVVHKSCEEDVEHHWDRAWAFARALRLEAGHTDGGAWDRSFGAAFERKGCVF
jgi:hypothetical protein